MTHPTPAIHGERPARSCLPVTTPGCSNLPAGQPRPCLVRGRSHRHHRGHRRGRDPHPRRGEHLGRSLHPQPEIGRFAHDHWLDGRRPLEALPAGYDAGRRALHQVAFFVVAPARYAATGKLGLRYTRGGFGTPFFDGSEGDRQIRVEGDRIIDQTGASVRAEPITSLAAARFLAIEYRDLWFQGFHDPSAPTPNCESTRR